jgi:hypothetical protein
VGRCFTDDYFVFKERWKLEQSLLERWQSEQRTHEKEMLTMFTQLVSTCMQAVVSIAEGASPDTSQDS